MSWPIAPDYNDAIQNPEMNLRDPCLKRGTIATNQLGLPVVASGNFASVFQVSDGLQRWAVKCFTRQIRDQQERYKAISDHLKAHALPFTVEFDYQQEGILVGGAWYPLLRMQWVDGPLLDAYVREQVNNKQALQQLATKWLLLIESLRRAGVAHGDLQSGNVKIVGDDIRLIDYDGMYVPALKQKGSNENGHPNFQHPRRSGKDFDQYIDNFSAWVIYTSLIALVEYPAIWDEAKGGDDCLIFQKSDFDSPASSPVFEKLERVGSKDLRALLARIRNYTHLAPQQVPPLDINTRAPRLALLVRRSNISAVSTANNSLDTTDTHTRLSCRSIADSNSNNCLSPRAPSVTAEDSRTTNTVKSIIKAILKRLSPASESQSSGTPGPTSSSQPTKTPTYYMIGLPIIILILFASIIVSSFIPKTPTPKFNQQLPPVFVTPIPKTPTPKSQQQLPPVRDQVISSRTTGMKLTLIPAGTFTMGSPTSEVGRFGNETQHVVKITKPFYMGVYEVTQGEYESVMGRNPSYFSITRKGIVDVPGLADVPALTPSNYPVDSVSWDDTQAFCKRLSEQDGVRYRLPTEAEWEYACRAGTTTPFYWGTWNNGTQSNSKGEDPDGTTLKRTTTVGSYGANPFGLYDMHGNVMEWCSDKWDEKDYGSSPWEDPQGPASGSVRVVRGGSWYNENRYSRAANRVGGKPGNRSNSDVGLRVVSESVRTP
ncbi:MAG: SUMF1/EgtB/PvdO family nonheme iron enzyme [Planctomycetales bacterium]|nr:SUMF1/EgtB/PvdO family nonheme iron enzyme [Planctomycetales bacterium]